ncbi:MAG: Hpt domain-containing protein [Variovorax sp.]
MTAANTAFAAFLAEQRLDYQRSLPPRVEQMQALWQQVLDGQATDDALPTLERHAHSIAGSAATFGCAPLGDAARALEMILTPLVESGAALNDDARAGVSAALALLPPSLPAVTGA